MGQYMDVYEGLDRVTVAEAAERLGVKEQAIRKRIARGTLLHDKDPDGRVYVYIDAEAEDEVHGTDTQGNTHLEALVDSLQDQVRFLREELARKDALMLNMTHTMRQLTAPTEDDSPEPREPPDSINPTRTPTGAGGEPQANTGRPWWRRVFGG